MDDLIYLVEQLYTQDSIGQLIPSENVRPVWAQIRSITRAEWYDGGQKGMQPQLVVVTPSVNYNGETVVEMERNGKRVRYGVYRTYMPSGSDEIELYLERKAGIYVKNG